MNKKQNINGSVNSAGFFCIRELYKSLTLKFYLSPQKRLLGGFSLMEMMIVLLIVAIIAAATAPMVSKKLARNAGTADSPWVFTGLSDNVAFNQGGGNLTAIIGANGVPNDAGHSKLYINASDEEGQIGFGVNGSYAGKIQIGPRNNIGILFGENAQLAPAGNVTDDAERVYSNGDALAIGFKAAATGPRSVALGRETVANTVSSVAIGNDAKAQAHHSSAFGHDAKIKGLAHHSTAVGHAAEVGRRSINSVALGYNATIDKDSEESIAIGHNAEAKGKKSIAIGGSIQSNTTTYSLDILSSAIIFRNRESNALEGRHPIYTLGIKADEYPSVTTSSKDDAEEQFKVRLLADERVRAKLTNNTNNTNYFVLSIALNSQAQQSQVTKTSANGENSIAIGTGVTAAANQVVIGTTDHAVSIPGNIATGSLNTSGNLIVSGNSTISGNESIGGSLTANQFRTNTIQNTNGNTYLSFNNNVVTLGNTSTTVHIPGHLVVGGYIEGNNSTPVSLRTYSWDKNNSFPSTELTKLVLTNKNTPNGYWWFKRYESYVSDRRLKNVGEKFTGGLEELKKLDLYHYTFKKDEKKTPQVGVMAQDLRKVFPNAVWEGEDGYLKIRWDEMFYAVINAVKELDSKISTAFEQIKANTDKINELQTKIDEQQKVIAKQQQTIDELSKNIEKQNAEFEKRLKKLEQTK